MGLLVKVLGLLLVLTLGSSCAGVYEHKVNFNTSNPIRVAVLPFVQVSERNEIIQPEAHLFIDGIPLVSRKMEENPPEFMRQLVEAELAQSRFDLVKPFLVNIELPHEGYALLDGSFDLKKVYASQPAAFCGKFLACDAVLYGIIKRWDRSYYGLESVSSIELELKLVDAETNTVLFESLGRDSDSRGLTKGPTGISDLILAPASGLDAGIISDLSRRMVRKMLDPLMQVSQGQVAAPPIPGIYAATHDRPADRMNHSERLLVVMLADPGLTASFSIGRAVLNVPMIERTEGHYVGEYIPVESDHFSKAEVTVRVTDSLGRAESLPIRGRPVTLE